MSKIYRFGAVVGLALATACASGTPYSKVEAELPPLAAGQARLYIFTPARGFALSFRPPVLVDGEPVGHSRAGSFLVVDRPAGEVTVTADKQASFSSFGGQLHSVPARVSLSAGANAYVEMEVESTGVALRVMAVTLDPAGGQDAIRRLTYAGGNVSPEQD